MLLGKVDDPELIDIGNVVLIVWRGVELPPDAPDNFWLADRATALMRVSSIRAGSLPLSLP
jgi:hypothetical protein